MISVIRINLKVKKEKDQLFILKESVHRIKAGLVNGELFKDLVQLLFLELVCVKPPVNAFHAQQFTVRSVFHNPPAVDHQNPVCISDS